MISKYYLKLRAFDCQELFQVLNVSVNLIMRTPFTFRIYV